MVNRKQFIESHGASCKNDRYAWGFVNHEEKFVIFGAWDEHTTTESAMIFSHDWKTDNNGRKQNAYEESLSYINLVRYEDYNLKTFPMVVDTDYKPESGSAKIKEFIPELSDMQLHIEGDNYYAIGAHKTEYSKIESNSFSNDIEDIFNTGANDTDRQTLINARVGQGKFRQNVIDVWQNGKKCALTLIDIEELLIASHIVGWAKCESNEQRLDGANGILLCAHVDKLFDRHKLTFKKKGRKYVTVLSKNIDHSTLKTIGIHNGYELSTEKLDAHFAARFDSYIQKHNEAFDIANT